MAYCPRCLAEYMEGTDKCEDCGAWLLGGPLPASTVEPPEDVRLPEAKLVPICAFSGLTVTLEADLAKNLLEVHRIPSMLSGDLVAGPFPGFPVVLLVREEDAKRAARILKDYLGREVIFPAE
jgi:hypothetical protein